MTPPDERGVGYVLIVLIDEPGSGLGLHGLAERLIDVLVIAELLDDEARGEAEGPARCARHGGLLPSWACAPSQTPTSRPRGLAHRTKARMRKRTRMCN